MKKRESMIQLWFTMWLEKKDLGIQRIFADDVVYIESWGPEYHGIERVKQWFDEWNRRGTVLQWDIKQFIHTDEQTVVEWYFRNTLKDGMVEAFDGVSLIRWNGDGKIIFLQEFGCNQNRYDPYQNGSEPHFKAEKAMWF